MVQAGQKAPRSRYLEDAANTREGSGMSGIDDWFDEKTLLDMAPTDVFLRGASAAEHGSVQILERDEEHLRGRVEDTEVLTTEFWLSGGELKWSCTCGAAKTHPCEHLMASALATWPGEAPRAE
jgi:uncharacterized Zn finger protein